MSYSAYRAFLSPLAVAGLAFPCIEVYYDLIASWETSSCPEDWMYVSPEACELVYEDEE
jgi:hypothetical protein